MERVVEKPLRTCAERVGTLDLSKSERDWKPEKTEILEFVSKTTYRYCRWTPPSKSLCPSLLGRVPTRSRAPVRARQRQRPAGATSWRRARRRRRLRVKVSLSLPPDRASRLSRLAPPARGHASTARAGEPGRQDGVFSETVPRGGVRPVRAARLAAWRPTRVDRGSLEIW